MPITPLQMDSWNKRLEAFIFLSFLRKFKILLSFPFEYFGLIISCKMNSKDEISFDIDTYPIPVINIKNGCL